MSFFLDQIMSKLNDRNTRYIGLTVWMFHARTVPSVEALQTVALVFHSCGRRSETPCRYARPTTLPAGQHTLSAPKNERTRIAR